MSTGCHVHFAVNHGGVWENPRTTCRNGLSAPA